MAGAAPARARSLLILASRANGCRSSTTIRLGVVVVGVGRTYFAVGVALVVESPLRFRLALLVLLTIPAQARKWRRLEPLLGDLQSAGLADAVGTVVEALERVVEMCIRDSG